MVEASAQLAANQFFFLFQLFSKRRNAINANELTLVVATGPGLKISMCDNELSAIFNRDFIT